jgi:ParB-like chromosome segregation protein Spo0J
MESHPTADAFPLTDGAEFDALVASVKANGLREPITTFEGKILDGRNRYRACQSAGVTPVFKEFTDDDPVAYVTDNNIRRRHLSKTQLALAGAKLAALPRGRPSDKSGQLAEFLTEDKAAKLLNISPKAIRRAKQVLEHGVAELVTAVSRGEVSISAAAEVAPRYDHERQRKLVADGGVKAAAEKLRNKKRSEGTGKPEPKPESPPDPVTPTTNAPFIAPASFRVDERETEKLRAHAIGLGHRVIASDLLVDPNSKSANARQSLYGLIRMPHSHDDLGALRATLYKLARKFNTELSFSAFPKNQPEEAAEEENNMETDHE